MPPNATPPGPGRPRTDVPLVRRARDGDADAWERLATDRLPGAWRLARAILPDDAAAADAVTTAFAAGWRELPRLDDLERFDDWLDRILLSECRMRLATAGAGGGAAPVPDDLANRVLLAGAATPRPRPTGGASGRSGPGRGLIVGLVVLFIALAGVGVAATRGWLPGLAVAGPNTTPSGPATANPTGPSASPAAAEPTPLPSGATGLVPGSIARVTLEGDNLRVRSAPSVAETSEKLKPLLPAGTRLLVVDGPVEADGHTWYEVQTDGELVDLFGWVAADGDGLTWVAPDEPRCFGQPDAAAVTSLTRIDYLACHGSSEVVVEARAGELWDARPGSRDCGWLRRRDGCDLDTGWLLLPSATIAVDVDGESHDLVVAVPPDLADKLARLPRQPSVVLTLSLDSPEAAGCRARDASTGDRVIPDEQAVTACRLQFVVQAVEIRMSGDEPSS